MKKLVLVLMLFLLLPIVIAVQPSVQYTDSDEELVIQYPKQYFTRGDAPFTFEFHVYNETGFIVDNTTVACSFHLYNSTGEHIISADNITYDLTNKEFKYEMLATEASGPGYYSYLVQCNDSSQAGFLSVDMKMTNDGDTDEKNDFIAVVLVLLGCAALFIWMAFSVDSKPLSLLYFLIGEIFMVVALHVGIVAANDSGIIAALDLGYMIGWIVVGFTLVFTIITFVYELIVKNKSTEEEGV